MIDFSVKLEEAKKLLCAPESCLKQVQGEVLVLVHPKYASNIKEGVSAELNSMIKRYSKELNGIPMAYENVKLLSPHAWLFDTNPFSHIVVRATFYVFMPEIGNILEAVVKKKSKFHIGCLVHGMFNVSVPKPLEMNLDDWCGAHLQEGDSVKLTVTDMNMTSFLPYIKGDFDAESIQELIEARKLEMTKQEEKTQNTRLVFDDSGISSNEVDEPVDDTQTKKKKKKKELSFKEVEVKDEPLSSEELAESTLNESDITEKKKKKKKKKRELESHSEEEANESLISENNESPKKKKKKKKKEKDDEFFDSLLNDDDIKSEENTEMATPEDIPLKVKKEKHRDNSLVNEEEVDGLLNDADFKTEESEKMAEPEMTPAKKKKDKKKKKHKDHDISFSDMDTSVVKEEDLDASVVKEKKKKRKRSLEDTLNESSIKRELDELEINSSSIDAPVLEEGDSPKKSKKRKADDSISGSAKRRKRDMI